MAESKLSPALITDKLKTGFVGQKVIYHPRLTSTMDVAREEAKKGAKEGTIVTCDEQTAGKGRLQRGWLSPKGSIAVSVILYPELSYLPSLIMVMSLAVVHAIARTTDLKAQIKWPNDILINGKKICGILIESSLKGNRLDYTVTGIGINVNFNPADFPQIPDTTTSLANELGGEISRLDLVRSLLAEIERLYLSLPTGDSVYKEWRDNLVTLGQEVQVTSDSITCKGTAESVSSDGSLLLRQPDGRITKIVAGDVTLR